MSKFDSETSIDPNKPPIEQMFCSCGSKMVLSPQKTHWRCHTCKHWESIPKFTTEETDYIKKIYDFIMA